MSATLSSIRSTRQDTWRTRAHCGPGSSATSWRQKRLVGTCVSPCVSAIIDGGTLPCVDVPYEAPAVGQFECEDNGSGDLDTSSSHELCTWAGEVREVNEMFQAVSSATSSGSPPAPETSPAPSPPNLSPTPGTSPRTEHQNHNSSFHGFRLISHAR